MTIHSFSLDGIHPSWHSCVKRALTQISPQYLEQLLSTTNWLPGSHSIFNAFSIPIDQVNYVLLGESPYPRAQSANGYAFWDADVKDLWSASGLSKKVNRATSLRNIMKMLLVADHALNPLHVDQEAIAKLDKHHYIKTNTELFNNLLAHGFLLLNATPVLQAQSPQKDARIWRPFLAEVLNHLATHRPNVKFILLGRIAKDLHGLLEPLKVAKIYAEHPYNYTFITNQTVLDFFAPLLLLRT